MRYIKIVVLVFLISAFFGCAKSVKLKYAEPETKLLCEENFYIKYYMLIPEEQEKEFENIKTISECREFLDKFWKIRDTDPTTANNEWQEMIERRAADIENEALFQDSRTAGFSFKNNGDFNGDAAKVYMLHGAPDYTETLKNGITHVDLMLWIYADERGNHKYRFLFYHKGGIGTFYLLRPSFDILFGLQEINKNPGFLSPWEAYYELERSGKYVFLYSLVYFSDLGLHLDDALRPPRPASEIAKELAPKIIGDAPQKEEIIIGNNYNSLIPAELSYETDSENFVVKIAIRHENMDWILKNGELTAELFIKITAWNENEKREENNAFDVVSTKEKIAEKRSTFIFESNPINISHENLKISVYIKNNSKYNAWIEEIR